MPTILPPRGAEANRFCRACNTTKPLTDFYRNRSRAKGRYTICKPCWSAKQKARDSTPAGRAARSRYCAKYRASTKGRRKAKDFKLRRDYNITIEDYERMATAQGGCCAICHKPPTKNPLYVDHCHKTGRIRGLLCAVCNHLIARVESDAELFGRIVQYLKR